MVEPRPAVSLHFIPQVPKDSVIEQQGDVQFHPGDARGGLLLRWYGPLPFAQRFCYGPSEGGSRYDLQFTCVMMYAVGSICVGVPWLRVWQVVFTARRMLLFGGDTSFNGLGMSLLDVLLFGLPEGTSFKDGITQEIMHRIDYHFCCKPPCVRVASGCCRFRRLQVVRGLGELVSDIISSLVFQRAFPCLNVRLGSVSLCPGDAYVLNSFTCR